jgi:hypothetical protein
MKYGVDKALETAFDNLPIRLVTDVVCESIFSTDDFTKKNM